MPLSSADISPSALPDHISFERITRTGASSLSTIQNGLRRLQGALASTQSV
jgi:hypothetical protein